MIDIGRHASRPGLASHRGAAAAGLVVVALLAAAVATAGDHTPFEARNGLDIARAAAQSWAEDAVLVYIENDEDVNDHGAAIRWGYLFSSRKLEKSRAYSVQDGKLLVAENLEMSFDAPPLEAQWIDSGSALEAAERDAGQKFRRDHQGALSTMMLMRGGLSEGNPNASTWTVVYSSPGAPSLFVVVDATEGKVRKTWRGCRCAPFDITASPAPSSGPSFSRRACCSPRP